MKLNKYFYSGFGAISALLLIAALAGTHTVVGVAACDYCKIKTVAEVQSDSLDKVAVNESKKDAIIVADNEIFIDKVKADVVVAESFVDSYNRINTYAAKEQPEDGDTRIADNDDVALYASLLKRYDQTAAHYRMATNTLIGNDSASVGGRQASRHKQGFIGSTGYTASGAIAGGGQQLHSFSQISARTSTTA